MKHLRKKAIAAMLATGIMFSLTPATVTSSGDYTQEELEQLKSELQKEIDRYYEDLCESEGTLGMIFNSISSFPLKSSRYEAKEVCQDEISFCEAPAYDASADAGLGYGYPGSFHTEEYSSIKENGFVKVSTDPLSTFGADVDTGSYCNLRRMINENYTLDMISSGAVRTEELLNYFDYEIPSAALSDGKFSVDYEVASCPWNTEHDLLRMTVQTNETDRETAGNNFTFLLDTSGSMDCPEKIALAKCSIKLLSYTLTEKDRISIVTYSGDSYTALDSCAGNDYETICKTLDQIQPYGGTNGSGGIMAAYDLAGKNYIENGNNRVFILSDGDMNLGITSEAGLVDLITREKETGIFLTVLGFGSGNYSDTNMEGIADAGNGNYFYIDCLDEAQHILIDNQKKTTLTVAKDVKFQAEFNPSQVAEYRLIGYENRDVSDDDFLNDNVDGGEAGAGDQVTLLYELVPAGGEAEKSSLKYQGNRVLTESAKSGELLTVSINYKEPDSDISSTESYAVMNTSGNESPSEDMCLAISLAELGMLLHDSSYIGTASVEDILFYAEKAQKNADIYRMDYELMLQHLFSTSQTEER